MKVFTTINPYGNFDAQTEALLSWTKYYEVYSVNPSNEIEIAKEKYPFVNFISTDQIYEYSGKKLVRLIGIIDAIKKNADGQVAIVNSDIILSKKIEIEKPNDVIISTRWELDDGKTYPFTNGYDLFIFDSKFAELFYNKNYVIGMPWWDFYIPFIAIKAGLKLYHLKSDVIQHRTHPTNYDSDTWIKFGEFLYNDLMITIMKNPMSISVFDFCIGVKKFIEKNQIDI